ncbi:alpha/beta hydrolase [Marichromatium purpuratum 984]|uniref:Alpha/beta hydrolase n=2 Tax=Marichromatium purpuratum TaxID=37487 RepID=W0E6Q6_MARPU|nr:alpha/beta hydrolase [Marichromatium purpuratum 984]
MAKRLDWARDGTSWPNHEHSRFVSAAGVRWHVQVMGRGPVLLLVHGTGAATHSWRDLAPLLAERFTLVAPDLPGHGFSAPLPYARMSLPGMAEALVELLACLRMSPALVLGHSAGAAILTRAALTGGLAPRALISLNGALLPWRGLPGHVFSPTARLFATTPMISRFLSWHALDRKAVEGMVASTGSVLEARGVDLYRRLVGDTGHVRATLSMMANWDLSLIERGLSELRPPLFLVVGEGDRTVSPREAERVRTLAPDAELVELPGLGHLAHEERPLAVGALVLDIAARQGL